MLRAVEQLCGAVLPASALESLVLPARVVEYQPALLDELMATGEVLWQGHGSLAGDDGWVSLHLADLAPVTLAAAESTELGPTHEAVLAALGSGGAYFFRTLAEVVARATGPLDDTVLADTLWDLLWAGLVTNDTLSPLRAYLAGGRTAHKARAPGPRRSRYAGRAGALGAGARGASEPARLPRGAPPTVGGRWSLLPAREPDPTVTAYARAEVLLDRYGVLTRGSVAAEDVPGGFAGVYRVLSAAEEAGRVRRGYFVEGLGAAQFGTTGAVDRLRAGARPLDDTAADVARTSLVLAACDPANPYGAALPWPSRGMAGAGVDSNASRGHQPARKAGALVVLVDGALVLYVERGGRTLLTWSDDLPTVQAAADALALAVREGALGRLTVERSDGERVLRSDHPLVQALAQAGFHADAARPAAAPMTARTGA